ncbi:MAG: hypothetical protein OEU51_02775 [Gammaproteobacteria bacterium]|nr:hypothetical protein [Gammaproteobacteria bacterium]
MNNGNNFSYAKTLLFSLLMMSAGIYCSSVGAQSFGTGSPQTLSALPKGDFRSAVESLPASGRKLTLQWLQSIEFTSHDLAYMRVDSQGGVYYADTFASAGKSAGAKATAGKVSGKDAFKLHSYPGAKYKVFIDFDGGVVSGTAWNSTTGVDALEAAPYDTDGKPGKFSAAELSAMKEIWQQVAEDFAPFKVDVTTEDPGQKGGNAGWILVTQSTGGKQPSLPEPKAGGISYINTFGFSHTPYYSPAFVYSNNLGSTTAVAGAVSHGMGHLVGLSHDGSAAGKGSQVSWAPIMGLDPEQHVTQWSNGGSNSQDDIAILTGRMGLRRDDHDDTRYDKGTRLVVDGNGRVNPVAGDSAQNQGVIEDQDDIDVFVFKAAAGNVDLVVTPAWQAFAGDHQHGGNLDVHVALFNANGKQIAEQGPRNSTAANLKARVPGGRYVLEIKGVANPAVSHSEYGSIGRYYITGTVPSAGSKTALR